MQHFWYKRAFLGCHSVPLSIIFSRSSNNHINHGHLQGCPKHSENSQSSFSSIKLFQWEKSPKKAQFLHVKLEIQLGDRRNHFHYEKEKKCLILQGKKCQKLIATMRERIFTDRKRVQIATITVFKNPLKSDYLHWPISKAIDKDKQGQTVVSSDSLLIVWIRWTKRAGIIH